MKENRIVQKEGLMSADMNEETVILDVTTGKYYNFGIVGGEIWNRLKKPHTLSELVKEYDVSPEQCETDVFPFIEKMLKVGLAVERKE